jgi:carboxymethylenebutenolidase
VQTGISFPADDGVSLPGVLTVPDSADGPGPALVLIYEAYGMTDEMQRVARGLAAEGYAVLIPDLFARGRVAALCVARAVRTVRRGSGRELDDIEAGRRWPAERPEVDADRIGTVGVLPRRRLRPRARGHRPVQGECAVLQPPGGGPARVSGRCELRRAGRHDPRVSRATRVAARGALGVPHDVVTYPDAGHSFFIRTPGLKGAVLARSPLRAEYHADSAADAHRRIVTFLQEHL